MKTEEVLEVLNKTIIEFERLESDPDQVPIIVRRITFLLKELRSLRTAIQPQKLAETTDPENFNREGKNVGRNPRNLL